MIPFHINRARALLLLWFRHVERVLCLSLIRLRVLVTINFALFVTLSSQQTLSDDDANENEFWISLRRREPVFPAVVLRQINRCAHGFVASTSGQRVERADS